MDIPLGNTYNQKFYVFFSVITIKIQKKTKFRLYILFSIYWMKKILKIIGVSIFALLLIGRGFYAFYFLRSPQRAIPNNDEFFVSPANCNINSLVNIDMLYAIE